MKRTIVTGILALAAGVTGIMAQKAPGPPKSKEEAAALQALGAAQGNPDATIAAAEALITKFADTEYKSVALFMEAAAYQQKGDFNKMQIFAEQVLDMNPQNFQAALMLSEHFAMHTRENDLDREEKLGKAEKYANDTITFLKTAPKPNPGVTDPQWEEAKKDLTAEAYNSIGLAELTRKKYDAAAAAFKSAVESAAHVEPAYQVRWASALQSGGKNDEALALCDKIIADPQAHPQIKGVAQSVRALAVKAGAKAPPAK